MKEAFNFKKYAELILLTQDLKYLYHLASKLSNSYEQNTNLIQEYLKNQPSEYISELQEFEKINGVFLPDNRRAFIFVPAYNENDNLKNLLEQYLSQQNFDGTNIEKSLYEICIMLNYPTGGKNVDLDHKNFEESINIINQFRANGADNIYIVAKAFPEDIACLGLARKYAMDYSLLRISHGTQEQKMNSFLISNEGDTLKIPKTYIASFIRLFEDECKYFVQGAITYPPELTSFFEPLRIFTSCREAVHFGMGILDREFKYYDGILPIGRNFAVRSRLAAAVGGIDPIKRIGTDDDMVFGTDISQFFGNQYKSFHAIPLTTNPRREILIVADLMNDGIMNSGKAYSEFHKNMQVYSLTLDQVIRIAQKHIPLNLNKGKAVNLLDHYFNWVLRSTAMEHLSYIPGFEEVHKDYRAHNIGYWEKEADIVKVEKSYLYNIPQFEKNLKESEIVLDALNWFNYFCSHIGLKFECTFNGLDSKLSRCL